MDAWRAPRFATLMLALSMLLGALVGLATAHGAEAHGIVVHDPQTTFRDFCRRDDAGVLWLEIPGGLRFELIESTADPAIVNPGDGAFHPFEESRVREALAQVRYPLGALRTEVFILPLPRRHGLESAAAPGLILLSPGVRPLSAEQQHAEFIHELGHVVQYALMPDALVERWGGYRRLRGIQDEKVFAASGAHAYRPHEIFAEDFRALFGGATANYSGTIENPDLAHPSVVPGLEGFIVDLAHGRLGDAALRVAANPARASVRFESGVAPAEPLDILDVAGRRIAVVQPSAIEGGVAWTWDRRDLGGARVGAGVVFARSRGGRAAPARGVLAPWENTRAGAVERPRSSRVARAHDPAVSAGRASARGTALPTDRSRPRSRARARRRGPRSCARRRTPCAGSR
jgi:hypothetical protein